jgi:AAHS family 4-hydroxybenzoate transporter-like MFS transporter
MSKQVINVDDVVNAGGVGRFQIMVCLVGILVLTADGCDLQIISYLMPQIVKEWNLPAEMQGTILSSGYFGVMIGYLLLSPPSAKFGLKRTVVICLIMMGLTNVGTITASSPSMLIAFRIATGIALGGVFPPAIALTVEYFPARYRASVVTIMYVGLPLGFLIAGWIAWMILPGFGWRGAMLATGVIPLLLSLLVFVSWPESLEFLINRATCGMMRAQQILARFTFIERNGSYTLIAGDCSAASISLLNLFHDRQLVGTLALWLGLSLNAMVYFFVLSWLPLILVRIGATQENAILASSLINVGGIAAAFITGPLMDGLGSYRIVFRIFMTGSACAVLVGAVLSPVLSVIVPAAICLGFCVSGLQKGISALAMRFYPTQMRSVGLGWVFGIGRSGAIVGPMLAGILMGAGWAPSSIFYFMSAPLLIGGIGIAIMWAYYGEQRDRKAAASQIETGREGGEARSALT